MSTKPIYIYTKHLNSVQFHSAYYNTLMTSISPGPVSDQSWSYRTASKRASSGPMASTGLKHTEGAVC